MYFYHFTFCVSELINVFVGVVWCTPRPRVDLLWCSGSLVPRPSEGAGHETIMVVTRVVMYASPSGHSDPVDEDVYSTMPIDEDFFTDDWPLEEECQPKSPNGDSLVIEIQQRPVNSSSIYEDIPGFAYEAGESYIYPTNYPIRDYQFNIVSKCLLRNTLVSLPTGLGKTFIAAVVMYNYYRWYPFKKVIFLAPTKPLVSQQVEACYNVMGMLLLGKS